MLSEEERLDRKAAKKRARYRALLRLAGEFGERYEELVREEFREAGLGEDLRTREARVRRGEEETHGTNAAYVAGCRCEGCREAHTRYVREWRRRRV